ncbi:hypothetical protein GDO78_011986 [Eleutherodactylus coqui]|uniref:Uncharacterized protein n=1 Tax=Eleutherodactylus coqui TaxID=57060 RepID=A0A8J6F3X6_ELECQ|nr:hypothetical protein GDO78_011986 [Eleutherodactylus coqui]
METRQRTQQGSGSAELAERRREAQGCLQTLSQHSYWFDLWIFLLFDLVLLAFILLLP